MGGVAGIPAAIALGPDIFHQGAGILAAAIVGMPIGAACGVALGAAFDYGYPAACRIVEDFKTRKEVKVHFLERLKQNGVVLPEKNPELYLQHLIEGGLSQAFTLSSRKRTWAEIERFEKALAAVEETLRDKGRTDHIERIAALRKELRDRTSRFHSKEKLFATTQDIRQRYAELDAQFEIHGTKGLLPLESVLYPDPQRALSEISLDLAVIQPANPKSKADVAAARELYAQSLTSGLSDLLEPARREGAKITISHDPKSGAALLTIARENYPMTETPFVEKDLEKLPAGLQSKIEEIAEVQQWAIHNGPITEDCLRGVVYRLKNK